MLTYKKQLLIDTKCQLVNEGQGDGATPKKSHKNTFRRKPVYIRGAAE